MKKRIQSEVQESKFEKIPQLILEDGKMVIQGDLVKIKGERGLKFKFFSLTTNIQTGAQWVDCFEVFRGQVGAFRSFPSDKIKRIPKRRVKRAK